MRLSFTLLSLLILIFLALNMPHLLEFTPVWPDEAWIADVALNILKTGQVSTDIWNGMIPGASQHVFWYPPVFFYLLAFWFKIFGFSIITQRLLALFISALFISLFYFFSKLLISKEAPKISETKMFLFAFLGSLLLIIDPTFFRSSVLSRPEILILVLVTCSLLLISKALSLTDRRVAVKGICFIIAGLLIGVSVLTHFLAGILLLTLLFYVTLSLKKFFFDKKRIIINEHSRYRWSGIYWFAHHP